MTDHEQKLLRLWKEIERVDFEDNKSFAEIVDKFMFITGSSESYLSERFGMSTPSVRRWRLGQSVPHPVMRPPVYKAFQAIIESYLV